MSKPLMVEVIVEGPTEHEFITQVLAPYLAPREIYTPEYINNSPETAPSKRLDTWMRGRYGKTTTGIAIARGIGIDAMRQACPLFHEWLTAIEALQ